MMERILSVVERAEKHIQTARQTMVLHMIPKGDRLNKIQAGLGFTDIQSSQADCSASKCVLFCVEHDNGGENGTNKISTENDSPVAQQDEQS